MPSDEDEERLVIDMFRGYNSLIRPSPCLNSSVVYVEFGVALILLINVDEKNQVLFELDKKCREPSASALGGEKEGISEWFIPPRQNFYNFWTLQKEMAPRSVVGQLVDRTGGFRLRA